MNKVIMYTKTICPYCVKAKAYLKANGVTNIEEINVESSPEKKQESIEKSGGRLTVPQIFIAGVHVGGCDDLLAIPNAKLKELLGV